MSDGNKRAIEFRGRKNKLDHLNSQKANQELAYLTSLYLGLAKRVFDMEKRMRLVFPMARGADYRSLAMMRIFESKFGVTREEVARVSNEVMVEDFDEQDSKDDLLKNLEPVLDAKAEAGLHAVINLKIFKNGVELMEEEVPRSKIELGKNELFPELDAAILGMSPGESKTFPLSIAGQSDNATVTLIALKKAKAANKEGQVDGKADESASDQSSERDPGEGGQKA